MVIQPEAKAPQEMIQDDLNGQSELVREVVSETKSYEDDQNAYHVAR